MSLSINGIELKKAGKSSLDISYRNEKIESRTIIYDRKMICEQVQLFL